MFLILLQHRLNQPPYNIPYEISTQIILKLPIISAAQFGAPQKLLLAMEGKSIHQSLTRNLSIASYLTLKYYGCTLTNIEIVLRSC